MRLIVTRPLAQALGWVAELQALGLDAQALPLIDIAPADDLAPIQQAWLQLSGLSLVMFVSANAVEHFFAARPAGATWPDGLPAGSTGPGTTAALQAAGVTQIEAPAADAQQFDTEALWARLSSWPWAGRQVLVVRGEEGRDWLADRLRQHGAQLSFVAAYRRRPPTLDAASQALLLAALAAPGQYLWLFSSSEAVGHLRTLAPLADWSAAAALASHPRIADAARRAGWGWVGLVAPQPLAVAQQVRLLQEGDARGWRVAAPTIGAPVNDAPVSAESALPGAASVPAPSVAPVPATPGLPGRWIAAGAAVLAALATAAAVLAWSAQKQVEGLEAELVKRQQDSGSQATEARTLARQAELTARETAAKLALLEARVAETSMQRTQIEELIQALARSRDENVLADLDAAIRVAMQQSAITGSADPLVLTLKQADERLARINQPRLERVRRAVAQDLERTRAAGVTDINVLTIRLDEVIRQVDELPLLSAAERRVAPRAARPAQATAPDVASANSAASAAGSASAASQARSWAAQFGQRWGTFGAYLWDEVKGLVRVTRIDQPEAMLVAPEQAFFLRENLKLRLLNARLALLSRQFDTAQSDLRDAQAALDRYFDRSARKVTLAMDLVKQVSTQSRLVTVPRPDATLAAIATASAGR